MKTYDFSALLAGRHITSAVPQSESPGTAACLMHRYLVWLAADRGLQLRSSLKLHILEAIIRDHGVFQEIELGEVTTEPPSIHAMPKEVA